MKNFRKGLKHQLERCERDLAAARAARDAATANACQDRLLWVLNKQLFLDKWHEMVTDKPCTENGRQKEYGSLGPGAKRALTEDEIHWNAQMIEAESAAATASTRRCASDHPPAMPAASTAPVPPP